jgi:hypothetical protein
MTTVATACHPCWLMTSCLKYQDTSLLRKHYRSRLGVETFGRKRLHALVNLNQSSETFDYSITRQCLLAFHISCKTFICL